MKKSYFFLFLIVLSLFLSSCAGGSGTVTNSWPSMTVDTERETVYLANGTHIYAVNLTNGVEKWRFPAEADAKVTFYAPPALTADGQLIAGGYNKVLYSLDPENGQVNWSFEEATNQYIAAPVVAGETILAASADASMYALNLSGASRWEFTNKHGLWASPAVLGSVVYLPSMDHIVYALDLETGEELWKSEDLEGAIAGTPTVGPDGTLYVGTFGSEMLALDGENGKVLWRFAASGWVWSGPALVDGVLYFGDLQGTLYAVNAASGSEVWKIQPDAAAKRAIVGQPLVIGESVYFTSESGVLYAVNAASGNPQWNKNLVGRIFTAPLQAGENILVSMYDADFLLVAMNSAGTQLWTYLPAK